MNRFLITVSILTCSFVMAAVPRSFAQGDSITVAISVIEDFSTESYSVIGAIDGKAAYKAGLSENKEKTLAELKTLNWVFKPGLRRFMRIHSIVSSYFEGEILQIKSFISEARPDDDQGIKAAHEKLNAIRNEKFRLLLASIESETYERKLNRPVPLIDSSPFEHEPDDATGLWYR
ncbi:MAG: hypothetical protein AABZ23_04500 [Deltaproteobacteria bacterium]